MPRGKDGQWIPEAHRADGYTQKDRDAALKPLSDFERAVRPDRPATAEPLHIDRDTVHRILMMELRPDGTALVQRRMPGNREQDAGQIYKWSAAKEEKESRTFGKSDLTQAFREADTPVKGDNELEL